MSKLPKAPLQEAIFEIRWELDVEPSTNQQVDLGFSLAQGKLQSIVRDRFPFFVRKIPYGIPELNYQIVNQYWSQHEQWPVIQLGPGIFTVNDTEENYDWPKTYYPLIKEALDWIYSAYEQKLKINFASLRYIDSVKLEDYQYEGRWKEFINEHFNISFVNDFNSRGVVKGIQFGQYFELEDHSALHIAMNSGKYRKTDADSLIWQTAVIKNDRFERESLLSWVNNAHSITSDLFKEMTKPHFYASFR